MRSIFFELVHTLVSRFPRWVVTVSFVLAALSGYYGVTHMQIITDQDRLISEDLPYHHQYMDFVRTFGDLEFLYIIIEGPTKEEMSNFAESLAQRLQQSEDIEDVIYAFDTQWAADYALYFDDASLADLRQLQQGLANNQNEIKALFDIHSIDDIFYQITQSLNKQTEIPTEIDPRQLEQLQLLTDTLKGQRVDPFADLMKLQDEVNQVRNRSKEYNWSVSGGFLLMLVMPNKDFSTLSVIEKPLQRIRADIWLTQQEFPHVTAGLTGRPALQADEMTTTNRDMMNSTALSLLGVTFLFILFFRELFRPLLGILTLLCTMGWTYGFIALTLGHLNLLSMVFALVLIGLGIDFGIHFLHRYQEELDREGDPSIAVAGALRHAGNGILTGAVTTAVAFLLAMTTDFLGLAELGYVAGVGIIFCLIAMLVTLPAMLITYDRHFRSKVHVQTPLHLVGLRHVSRFPAAMMTVITILTLVFLPCARDVRFNDNLLDMQAEGLESVKYEHKLMDDSEFSTWYCAFVEPDMDAVRKIVDRLKQDPTVADTDSLADVLPEVSPEKREIIHSLHTSLQAAVHGATEPYEPNPFIYQSLIAKVEALSTQLETGQQQIEQFQKLKEQIQEYRNKIAKMKTHAAPSAEPPIPEGLSPDQLEAMANDPQMAALLQAQQQGGTLPDGMQISPGMATPEEMAILPDLQLPEGVQLPEGMSLTDLLNGKELPEIPKIPAELMAQVKRLQELTDRLRGSQDEVMARLRTTNQQLLEKPRAALRTLAKLAAQDEPTPANLPHLFHRLFIGKDQSLLVMAYPKENIWETKPMHRFVDSMREIDPKVTGTPIQVYESSLLMRDSFQFIGLASVIAVGFLVFLDFLSLRAFFYVMFPLLLGVFWLVEIMGFLGIYLNLANFFAIPILIGIGVDNAVHFFHRYEESYDVERSMFTTGSTLTLTTLTTIVGFGSLIFASHKGLASLGALMALGSATCWFSCVVFLPTLIKLTCRHYKSKLEYTE